MSIYFILIPPTKQFRACTPVGKQSLNRKQIPIISQKADLFNKQNKQNGVLEEKLFLQMFKPQDKYIQSKNSSFFNSYQKSIDTLINFYYLSKGLTLIFHNNYSIYSQQQTVEKIMGKKSNEDRLRGQGRYSSLTTLTDGLLKKYGSGLYPRMRAFLKNKNLPNQKNYLSSMLKIGLAIYYLTRFQRKRHGTAVKLIFSYLQSRLKKCISNKYCQKQQKQYIQMVEKKTRADIFILRQIFSKVYINFQQFDTDLCKLYTTDSSFNNRRKIYKYFTEYCPKPSSSLLNKTKDDIKMNEYSPLQNPAMPIYNEISIQKQDPKIEIQNPEQVIGSQTKKSDRNNNSQSRIKMQYLMNKASEECIHSTSPDQLAPLIQQGQSEDLSWEERELANYMQMQMERTVLQQQQIDYLTQYQLQQRLAQVIRLQRHANLIDEKGNYLWE